MSDVIEEYLVANRQLAVCFRRQIGLHPVRHHAAAVPNRVLLA
jgi:hypothetical protein